jgi:hypothetical protein
MKNDPDSAAVLFKKFILSTVDTISSMNGQTVSNGRLNIHKMLLKAHTLTVSLNLTALIEGFYNEVTNQMIPDTARIYVRNSVSPYAKTDSSKSLINSNGAAKFNFSNVVTGTPYYLVLSHRNSIETWSASAQSFTGDSISYDLTTDSTKAFGNNLTEVDSSPVKFAVYGGDINQDGTVDVDDLVLIYNDEINITSGYINTDVTGDNFADVTDLIICYNNLIGLVNKITP